MHTTLTVLLLLVVHGVVDAQSNATASKGNTTPTPVYNGIRCLECHEVASPSECSTWVSCGEEEECYTREYYNRNMIRGYHMGCELKSRCDLYRSLSALLGKRDTHTCFECCKADDCNSALCGAVTAPVVTNNLNLRCLDCHAVGDPRLCDHWSMCGQDEVCFARSFVDSTGQLKFNLGCEFQQACLLPGNQTELDPQACMDCCETNGCNNQLCPSLVNQIGSSIPPTAGGGCPLNFYEGGNSCYYFSNDTKNWNSALTACRGLGAELASVQTQAENDVLTKLLVSTLQTKVAVYWIGGFYVTATSSWTWADYRPVTYTNWGPSQPSYTSYSYTIAMLNPQQNSGFTNWAWASNGASSGYNYICEMQTH